MTDDTEIKIKAGDLRALLRAADVAYDDADEQPTLDRAIINATLSLQKAGEGVR